MARLAILASGGGSNFEAIVKGLHPRHKCCLLICDRKEAYVFYRAKELGIPAFYQPYRKGESKQRAEENIHNLLTEQKIDLVALAGYMRLLSPWFVGLWKGRLINIHPSLLPKYPGAHGIEESFHSTDRDLGITIHFVDEGMDTGPIITQASFRRGGHEAMDLIEQKIHALEHKTYPLVINKLLNKIERST